MPDTPPLNYAPPPPLHRRRVFRGWFYTVVLLGIAASGFWWAPPAWRRVQLFYWQHECVVYTPPKDQLTYDETNHVGVKAAAWSNFYNILSPPGSRGDATLFLHELRKQNGERRLVVAEVEETNFSYQPATRNPKIEVWTHVFKLGTLTEQPAEVDITYPPGHMVTGTTGFGTILKATKVYAGNADPADATHFTFRTVDEQGEHIYDGWLQDDDSVAIGERRTTKSPR